MHENLKKVIIHLDCTNATSLHDMSEPKRLNNSGHGGVLGEEDALVHYPVDFHWHNQRRVGASSIPTRIDFDVGSSQGWNRDIPWRWFWIVDCQPFRSWRSSVVVIVVVVMLVAIMSFSVLFLRLEKVGMRQINISEYCIMIDPSPKTKAVPCKP